MATPAPSSGSPTLARTPRVGSVDVLRGLVMVIMALDHVRDYFTSSTINPTDPKLTYTALYLSRWITHLCAPTFVFLAGTAIYLQMRRKSKSQLARFLLTRGVWLIFLECTLLHVILTFNWQWNMQVLNILWMIGLSMIVMAGVIYLPMPAVAAFGLVLIAGHNFLDRIPAASFGHFAWLWRILHVQGFLTGDPVHLPVLVAYPLVPWPGVMALGFAFGPLLARDPATRRKWLVVGGVLMMAIFALLRLPNIYGDPRPWSAQATPLRTVFSIFDVTKYPPSLQFLLITLGISALLMALIDWAEQTGKLGTARSMLDVYGRAPFFYFLLHFLMAHALALFTAMAMGKNWRWFTMEFPHGGIITSQSPGFGFSLPVVVCVWILVVALCYPVCRWYADLKQSRRYPFLSYM
jgi:uncharacterized membrane protein